MAVSGGAKLGYDLGAAIFPDRWTSAVAAAVGAPQPGSTHVAGGAGRAGGVPTDMVLLVDERPLGAHRAVLAARSPVSSAAEAWRCGAPTTQPCDHQSMLLFLLLCGRADSPCAHHEDGSIWSIPGAPSARCQVHTDAHAAHNGAGELVYYSTCSRQSVVLCVAAMRLAFCCWSTFTPTMCRKL